ncbi:hypothetical protein SCE1572_15820 [Sorangium cellulosum So0157-2]|uniref:ABC transmembrane type-1 domain-containing protein n=1 Tax=Sorangium cellulosum So0157-2 TaxID=1254432 RepID=S4XTH8_SORCE|nr:hypothetical protein SCE1572_15820 [Sorangium cellulosum So0157-2]
MRAAAARSETTGKLVDSVTNLTSARVFARLGFEREYLDEQLVRELRAVRRSNWYSERVRWFQFASAALLKVGTLYYALALWQRGAIGVAEFVMATSLSLLIINEARNLSRRFLEFFEFVGNVANGVNTIIRSHELVDRPGAVDGVMKGKTVLVVAHRLSTIVHLDRILVFEDGRIIEDGTHAELLARNGAYKRLWSKQSDGFLLDGAAEERRGAPRAQAAPAQSAVPAT